MKKLRFGVGLFGTFGVAVSVFAACSDPAAPGPGTETDAAVADTAVPPPVEANVPDTAIPKDAAPPPDASPIDASPIDASPPDASPIDAAVDATVDAADAAPPPCGLGGGRLCNLGEACVVDGDCGAPNVCEGSVCAAEPPARTMADVAGLTHFDFEGTTLVYTSSADATHVSTCTLPGCADAAPVPNITLSGRLFGPSVANGYIQYPTTSSAGAVFTVAASRSLDGATAGPTATFNCADRLGTPTNPTLAAAHSGASGWVGLYKCLTDTRTSTGFFYRFTSIDAPAARTDRVGRGSPARHSNVDAVVSLLPGTQTVNPTGPPTQGSTYLSGTLIATQVLWGRAESGGFPSEMVTSPKTFGGVDIASPTIALRYNGAVRVVRGQVPTAFPTVVASGATTINLDERYLYVGTATGLGRCELSEIKATTTCTLAMMSADPVDAPLYLTATHAWYRSGTLVRRVAK